MEDLLQVHIRVNDLARAMVHDARTFHWLLTEQNHIYKAGVEKYDIGGGSFLVVLGLFSVLDLLAQYNWILNNGYKSKSELNKISKKLEKNEDFKRARKVIIESGIYLVVPKTPDHSEAFSALILEIFPMWKLDPDKLKKIWNFFRNKLTHMTYPNGLIGEVHTPGQNFKESEDSIPITRNPFSILRNEDIMVNSLTLIRNVEFILNTLKEKISNGNVRSERAIDVSMWLKDNLSLWFSNN